MVCRWLARRVSQPSMATTGDKKVWQLAPESELRFEVGPDRVFSLTLISGTAEIFGAELVPKKEYAFTDVKLAAFTWYGAQIETSVLDGVYVSEETPMVSYVNTHAQLEARRDVAMANEGLGPRVMIAGPMDSGKSSLATILSAYAARVGRCPIFVDLDVGQNLFSVPGTMTAIQVDSSVLSVEEGFGASAAPIAFFYGHEALGKNPDLYKHYIQRLAQNVEQRLGADKDAKASGLVVNTAGWIDNQGFQLLLNAIEAFKIDVVLVLAHDKLTADLNAALVGSGTTIIKLPRSGGVVQRDTKYRRLNKVKRIQNYFYGQAKGPGLPRPLAPSAIELSFDDVTLLRVGESGLSATIMPIGVDYQADPLGLHPVEPGTNLLHSILAVLHPGDKDPRQLLGSDGTAAEEEVDPELINANAAGFLHVTHVDLEKRRFRFLSPCPGALPSRYLLVGSVSWVEN